MYDTWHSRIAAVVRRTLVQGLLLTAIFVACCQGSFDAPVLGAEPSFTAVAMILRQHCLRCHNAREKQAELDISRRVALLRGGDNGPAIVPGEPDESLFLSRAREGSMPPINDGRALNREELDTLRKWVAKGALWPLSTPQLSLANPPSSSSPPAALPAFGSHRPNLRHGRRLRSRRCRARARDVIRWPRRRLFS